MGKRREQARAYWRGVIAECAASGLPAKVFCEQRGLSADAFYTWRRISAWENFGAFHI